MGEYSKFNIVYRLQKWMDSVPGQTFLNYAYSWGASVVIAGTLFKLTHLPGANFMLFLGMGTEVFVFFLSAFDRPFDKTADGRDIPTHVTEEYLETGKVTYHENGELASSQQLDTAPNGAQAVVSSVARHPLVEGSSSNDTSSASVEEESMPSSFSSSETMSNVHPSGTSVNNSNVNNPNEIPTSNSWVDAQQNVTPEMAEAQSNYVDELKKLVETLEKVNEQSTRLTRDSEEMENLNRTLTGISKVYEMQLKGASQQIGTIDQINDQSRKLAQQIEQLNKIYTRMIEAMAVNMRATAPHTSEE